MIAVLAWLVMVAIISLIQVETSPTSIPHADKVLHFFLYAITCVLFSAEFLRNKMPLLKALVLAVAISTAYGIVIEVVQNYMPGRNFSVADMAFDFLGAMAAAFFVRHKVRKRGESAKA